MQVQRIVSETGYILHSRPYRETSLILDILSPNYGRVSLVAKGVRQKKNTNNIFQPFLQYDFSWSGRKGLYTLTRADNQTQYYLFSSYQFCCGLYANELLTRLVSSEDPNIGIYQAYQQLLQDLFDCQPVQEQAKKSKKTEISLRLFEKKLLQHLGYGFYFDQIDHDKFYIFEHNKGLVAVAGMAKTALSISGESLLAFQQHQLTDRHLPEIKRLTRQALACLMGQKPLKSRELFSHA